MKASVTALVATGAVAGFSWQLDPLEESFELLEEGEHYAIYDAGVKTYPATTFLVQSSAAPIDLGADMAPLMDTAKLWEFIKANDIPVKANTPAEVYLYNWIDGAQGKMIFDVGVVVADDIGEIASDTGFLVKRYPEMKFASLVYRGPFPHEADSGWQHIRWEDRAAANGHVYTERLYRELYHTYDHVNSPRRHVTEIQIEIE